MEYLSFDPVPHGFPRPRVPVLPLPTIASFRLKPQPAASALLDSLSARFYVRGRYAMTDAYRLSGVGPDKLLLAPAYHCRTMLDPAIRLGAKVALYRLLPDLAPDLQSLRDLLEHHPAGVGAVLATHFFGFVQDLGAVRRLCEAHGAALIEDCSHCLFLPTTANVFGRSGHYCVSSPYKFFPMEDGGVLWASQGTSLPALAPKSHAANPDIKAVARAVQRMAAARSEPDVTRLEAELQALPPLPEQFRADMRVRSDQPSALYDVRDERHSGLRASRWAMRHTRLNRLCAQRQAHYRSWADAVATLPYCRALYPVLPANVVPYMFPLWVDMPDLHFFVLKQLGVPIWRWDDMAISKCEVAMACRTHLLHLPCHQELSQTQLHWMHSAVARVLRLQPQQGM